MTNIDEWGPASWYIFHALAEKCKEEHFNDVIDELLSFFKTMCYNLPCENCKAHAIHNYKLIILKNINSKNKLKKMLMEFHNKVNRSNDKYEFIEDDLNEKYSKANLLNIIEYFFYIWRQTNTNSKLMMNTMHKNRFLNKFEKWLQTNIDKFNL
jgi:hypothetical protein